MDIYIIKKMEKIKDKLEEYKVPELIVTSVGVLQPQIAVVTELIKYITSIADEFRFDAILRGLAEGDNMECKLNELYCYINSKDRAFWVSETFRKAMLGNSIIVCSIMGIILSNNIKNGEDFSQEDMVLMRALEHFTDQDIKNIDEIMTNNYFKEYPSGTKCIDKSKFPEDKRISYIFTMEYCTQYRLLNKVFEVDDKGHGFLDEIAITPQINQLQEYIIRVHRLIEYNINI